MSTNELLDSGIRNCSVAIRPVTAAPRTGLGRNKSMPMGQIEHPHAMCMGVAGAEIRHTNRRGNRQQRRRCALSRAGASPPPCLLPRSRPEPCPSQPSVHVPTWLTAGVAAERQVHLWDGRRRRAGCGCGCARQLPHVTNAGVGCRGHPRRCERTGRCASTTALSCCAREMFVASS